MKPMSSISKIALLAAVAALSACQEAGEATGVNPGENHGGIDQEGVTVLYSDAFSDHGALEIVSDPSGQVHYRVESRIGSNAERLMQQVAGQPTLADVYRNLHEGAQDIPDAVREASARLEAQKLLAPPAPESPVAEPLAKAAKSNDQSVFMNSYCKDFYEGAFHYAEKYCAWRLSAYTLNNGNYLNSNGEFIDRAYGFNGTGWTATMSHSVSGWKPTIAPHSVGWVQWGGTYQNAQAKITLPFLRSGELGITAHRTLPRRYVDL